MIAAAFTVFVNLKEFPEEVYKPVKELAEERIVMAEASAFSAGIHKIVTSVTVTVMVVVRVACCRNNL